MLSSFSDYFSIAIALIILSSFFYGLLIYVKDRRQKEHSILRSHPVFGHFRYILEKIGVFLRIYIVNGDDEEKPFSRNERAQIYRMSKGVDNTIAFGSSSEPKSVVFANSPFPKNINEMDRGRMQTIGKDCETPFSTSRFFHISGMSFGALSANAISALSHGAAQAGITLNTGEGGRASSHHLSGGASIVQQIGTANFGFRTSDGRLDYSQLDFIRTEKSIAWTQIKLSQGAKPGKGGILPAIKVTKEIAELRTIPVGEDCLSPNRNPEFSTTQELLESIRKIKQATGKPVGIKLALADTRFIDELCRIGIEMDREVEDGPSYLPSVITIDGGDGGTGASPALLMESVALPVLDILPDVDQCLKDHGIRSKIKLVASGKLITSYDVGLAMAHGADWVESARGFAFALGCIMSLSCNSGRCPTGIATQDSRLQKALDVESKARRVRRYADEMEDEVYTLAASCGEVHPRDLGKSHLRDVVFKG